MLKKILLLTLALCVIFIVISVWGACAVMKNPLGLYEWTGKKALRSAGLEETRLETSVGEISAWVGGEGTPLILLHGAGDSAAAWQAVAPAFAEDYRLVVPDLPGHGRSEPAEGPLTLATLHAGTLALVDEVTRDKPAVLVGNSLGAWLGMLAALERPERIERLVLVNGGGLYNEPGEYTLMPKDREEARKLMGALRSSQSPEIPDFLLDAIVRAANEGPIARIHAGAMSSGPFLLDGRLDSLTTPVEIIWGKDDQLLPLAYARRMEAGLPASRVTTIDTCGHVPQNECPDRLNAELAALLAESPPAPREVEDAP